MDLGLAGAAVCVQGGSKGMGRAAAECFAAGGARVAVMARGREGLDDTVAVRGAAGAAWRPVPRDVRPKVSPSQSRAMPWELRYWVLRDNVYLVTYVGDLSLLMRGRPATDRLRVRGTRMSQKRRETNAAPQRQWAPGRMWVRCRSR
jgi:hypothetical protein